MSKIDNPRTNTHNKSNFLFVSSGEETIKINKKDLKFNRIGGHQHQYKPDFSDEWDEAIALKCVLNGCQHGRMHPKQGEEFMAWLDEHRAKA